MKTFRGNLKKVISANEAILHLGFHVKIFLRGNYHGVI